MSWKVIFRDPGEPISIKIWKYLLSNRKLPAWGIALATSFGCAVNSPVESHVVGLLGKDIVDPSTNNTKKRPRREFIGTIWCDKDGANELNWIFYVYGRKHIELAKQLAEEIASTFDVNIIIRLTGDSMSETFSDEDGDW